MIPRFSVKITHILTQNKQQKFLAAAQDEMNAIIAEIKIIIALPTHIPLAVSGVHEMGEDVLVYSENEKEWVRSILVVYVTVTLITIQTPDGTRRQIFNAF